MGLTQLTKITGPGIKTDTNWVGNNALFTGITTFSNLISSEFDADVITSKSLVGTGLSIVGVVTATSANFAGDVSIGGTLTYEDVKNVDSIGVVTARNGIKVGSGVTIEPNGQATFTGIVTFGSSSTTIDGDANTVKVGTALTLGHTQGLQFHTQNLHSAGFEVNQINATGIITATSFAGSGANLTGLASREFYGFKAVNEDLILIHTNNGADNISLSDFESFEDTMTAPSGLSFSINSAGELEMTI